MKVRAIKIGYVDDCLRRSGDVFSLLNDRDFARSWMVRVTDDTAEQRMSGQATIDRLHDERFAETRQRAPAVDIDTGHAATEFNPFR